MSDPKERENESTPPSDNSPSAPEQNVGDGDSQQDPSQPQPPVQPLMSFYGNLDVITYSCPESHCNYSAVGHHRQTVEHQVPDSPAGRELAANNARAKESKSRPLGESSLSVGDSVVLDPRSANSYVVPALRNQDIGTNQALPKVRNDDPQAYVSSGVKENGGKERENESAPPSNNSQSPPKQYVKDQDSPQDPSPPQPPKQPLVPPPGNLDTITHRCLEPLCGYSTSDPNLFLQHRGEPHSTPADRHAARVKAILRDLPPSGKFGGSSLQVGDDAGSNSRSPHRDVAPALPVNTERFKTPLSYDRSMYLERLEDVRLGQSSPQLSDRQQSGLPQQTSAGQVSTEDEQRVEEENKNQGNENKENKDEESQGREQEKSD